MIVKDTVIDKLIKTSETEIEIMAANWSSSEIEATMNQLRKNMQFYKNILNEDFRGKNPKSLRYTDAEKKINKINQIGLKLKEILTSKTN